LTIKTKVSIVIPTLNEEENLPAMLAGLKKFLKDYGCEYEIIIVDGHSQDGTVEVAKKFQAKIIYDDGGKGSALRKGMGSTKYEMIVAMDADQSNEPKEIGLMLEALKQGFDICMGSRFMQGGGTGDMPVYRRLGNKFFVFLVNLFWGTSYSDLCYGYRALTRKALEKLNLTAEGFVIETEISIEAARRGLKILELPSFEKARRHGKGKLRTFGDGWRILQKILKEKMKDLI